jgi:alpha-1,2-mannosyltransferase
MQTEPNPSAWLTERRLRAHGVILALAVWLFYAWTISTPGLRDRNGNLKGTDFLHFYTLGLLANAHDAAHLYDVNAQAALAARHVSQAAGLRYLPLYPPQVSMLFAPLAHLPYGQALPVWWVVSTFLYGICVYAMWRACPNLCTRAGTVMILAAAFPPFFHLIAWGQTSALALLCFTAMFLLLRARREFAAGLVLGCLIFKPQLGLAAAVVFVFTGSWKLVAGAALSASAELAAGGIFYGFGPLREWLQLLANVGAIWPQLEPRPYQTYSLRTFWTMLVPCPQLALWLYVLSAIVILGLAIAVWKKSSPLGLRYSALLLATVLAAPHLTVYDLVILAPAILLGADWLVSQTSTASRRWLGGLFYLVYVLPLVGPVARWTHVQLAVLAMAAAMYAIFRVSQARTTSDLPAPIKPVAMT